MCSQSLRKRVLSLIIQLFVAFTCTLIAPAAGAAQCRAFMESYVVLDNGLIRVELAPAHGGRLKKMIDHRNGLQYVGWRRGDGGTLRDLLGGGYPGITHDKAYSVELEQSEHVAAATLTHTMAAGLWQGLRITRRVEVRDSLPILFVKVTMTNTSKEPRRINYRVHNELRVGDAEGSDVYFYPRREGVESVRFVAGKTEVNQTRLAPSAGWKAVIDTKRTRGVIARMSHEDLKLFLDWLYTDQLRSFEWQYEPKTIAPGESWSTEFSFLLVNGMSDLAYVGKRLVAGLTFSRGADRLAGRLEVAATEAPLANIKGDVRLEDSGGKIIGTVPVSFDRVGVGAAQSAEFVVPKPAGENARLVVSLKLSSGESVAFQRKVPAAAKPPAKAYQPTAAEIRRGYITWSGVPLELYLPDTTPTEENRARPLGAFAARGQTTPATLLVRAFRDTKNIRVSLEKAAKGKMLPDEWVDIRFVKVWLRHGRALPDILLKDDGLIEIKKGRNAVSLHKGIFRDAKELKPFDLPAETTKQLWINVSVPRNAEAGEYLTWIKLHPAAAAPVRVRLSLRVLPFELEPTSRIISIFWRSKILPDGAQPKLPGFFYPIQAGHSEHVSVRRYKLQVADMAAHGVNNVFAYEGDNKRLCLELLTGLKPIRGPITLGGASADDARTAAELGLGSVARWIVDEPRPDQIDMMKRGAASAHADGILTVATPNKLWSLETMQGVIDMPVCAISSLVSELPRLAAERRAGKWKHVLYYWQCWQVSPQMNRILCGLFLNSSGCDGVMPYVYQHGHGNMLTVFPSPDGPLPTLRWEGFREGVNDLRMIETYEALCAKLATIDPAKAKAARDKLAGWLSDVPNTHALAADRFPNARLDELRRRIAEEAARLHVTLKDKR